MFSYGCQALHSSREETLKESLQYPGILISFMKSLRGRKHRKIMSKSFLFENRIKSSSKVSTKIRTPERPGLHSPHRLGSPSQGLNETRVSRSPKRPHQTHGPLLRRVFRRSQATHLQRNQTDLPLSWGWPDNWPVFQRSIWSNQEPGARRMAGSRGISKGHPAWWSPAAKIAPKQYQQHPHAST